MVNNTTNVNFYDFYKKNRNQMIEIVKDLKSKWKNSQDELKKSQETLEKYKQIMKEHGIDITNNTDNK